MLYFVFISSLSYNIRSSDGADVYDSVLSHQYNFHGSHLEKVPGSGYYVKQTPVQEDLNYFTADESNSDDYFPSY